MMSFFLVAFILRTMIRMVSIVAQATDGSMSEALRQVQLDSTQVVQPRQG